MAALFSRGGIGLDIGTSAVRAVEVRPGSPPTVARFGQVLLGRGAVVSGEVADPSEVTRAIQTLWKRVGFGSKSVRVGMANAKVVTRPLALPVMPREDIEGAIRYQAQEQFPIPLDDAVVGFEVGAEMTGPEGQPEQEVFVVAAQRGMVDLLIESVQSAKLSPLSLELNAYPLVRALGTESALATQAEAIVDIGAGVTNVLVHESGHLKFVRILSTGGDDFTQSLTGAIQIEWDEAESLKHRCGPALQARLAPRGIATDDEDEESVGQAVEVLVPVVQRFVDEVRSSLDYYTRQADLPIGTLTVIGGGSLLGGLRDRLGAALRIEGLPGRPLARVQVGKVRLSPDQVAAAEPFLAVAVGLGLGAFEG